MLVTWLLWACDPPSRPPSDRPAGEAPSVTTAPLSLEAWPDLDGDGFGAGEPVEAPIAPGFADNGDDCDDDDPLVHPGDHEDDCHEGDPTDLNCDGIIYIDGTDEFFVVTGRVDEDADGYGGHLVVWSMCDPVPEEVAPDLDSRPDCDDTDPDVHPRAEELCDGVDNDCDDRVDERC